MFNNRAFQYNKFANIIKAMINQPIANKLLAQCGYSHQHISGLANFKMNTSASRFSIRQVNQLIYIKGSSYDRVKQCQNKQLLYTVRKKIVNEEPDAETRKTLWIQFTQIYQKPHFYQQIKQLQLPIQFRIIIEKDIKRTYKSEQTKRKAQQILSVFAIYNPYIGYCQGMNSIMAFLVDQTFTCEQSFYIFKYITQILLPSDYYSSMDTIMAYMRIFYELLSITHPKCYTKMKNIAKQMDNSYMAMVSFVLQWFVCLYTNENVNKQITRVIWDLFLLEGVIALFKGALAIFDLLQPHILKCNNFEQYNQMQKKQLKNIIDYQHVRKRMLGLYISPTLLFIFKQKLTRNPYFNSEQKQQQKKIAQNNKNINKAVEDRNYSKSDSNLQKNKVKKYKHIKCNRKWNACANTIQLNIENGHSYQYFVFKPKNQINIVQNYLDKIDKLYFNSFRQSQPADDLKIGRMPHTCNSQEQFLGQDNISDKSTQSNLQTRKKYAQSLSDQNSPIKISESTLRKKALVKIQQVMNKKPGMERSQSMIFMQKMVQNVSFSNLLQLYQIDEMFEN